MNKTNRTVTGLLASLILGFSGSILAGGFVELEGVFDDSSQLLTNPWWPLPEDARFVYLAETEDECVVSVLDVLPAVGQYKTEIKGVKVRTLWDREFIDDIGDCDGDTTDMGDWELLETTLDWYAQDIDGNIWYFGEHSVATDHDECDHPTDGVDPVLGIEGCLDGSWEAGADVADTGVDPAEVLEGIIMLRHPQKGQFYFQEFYEDQAEDMAKILTFKKTETFLYGSLPGCAVIKEWVPLEPGSIEHKYFCEGYGLVLVQGNAGGKTEWTDLVDVSP